jgi:hypothetical protein
LPGWLWTTILLTSSSWVARITGVSHQHICGCSRYYDQCLIHFLCFTSTKQGRKMEIRGEKMTGMNDCIFKNSRKWYLLVIPDQLSLFSSQSTFPIPSTPCCG